MNKIKLLTSATLASFLGLAISSAGAADMSSGSMSGSSQLTPEQQQRFDELSNHSDRIDKKQAKADPVLSKNFKHYDTNHDGYIDQSEFAAFEAAQGGSGGNNQDNQSNP